MKIDNDLSFKILEQKDNNIRGYFKASSQSRYFQGHFPDYPIVPGVLLLEISLRMLAVALNVPRYRVNVRSLIKISFLKPVMPDDEMEIELLIIKNEAQFIGFSKGGESFRFIACIK